MAARPVVSLAGAASEDLDEIVSSLGSATDDLRDATVLVTGASGWFGTWLLDALVATGRAKSLNLRVVALCRRPDAFARRHPALHAAAEITWVAGDVRDGDLVVDAPVTHVVHAATSSAAADDPDALFETIVAGTRNVLAIARRHRARRFLFVSSGAVYGPQAAGVPQLAEEAFDPAVPAPDAYARGKRAAEAALLETPRDGDPAIVIARCFAFVGPHMPFDAHFAIGNFIRDAMARRPIRIAGDGTPRRSYLYMSDLVAWLLVILSRGVAGRAYNVGSGDALTIAELAVHCAAIDRDPPPILVEGEAGGRDYVPDVSRATGELGLRVRVPLDDAIARTVRWRRGSARSWTASMPAEAAS